MGVVGYVWGGTEDGTALDSGIPAGLGRGSLAIGAKD